MTHQRSLVAAYRRVVRIQARDENGWQALSHFLERVQLLLNRREERKVLKQRWQALLHSSPEGNDQLKFRECDFFGAVIADQPAADQVRALLSRPQWTFNSIDLLNYFRQASELDLTVLLDGLSRSSEVDLERQLCFLLGQPSLALSPKNEDFLCGLLALPAGAPREPPSRCLAVQVLLRAGSERLWEKALQGGGLLASDVEFFRERWPNEQRFLNFRTHLDYAILRQSVDLATLGHLLVVNDRLGDDLARYVNEVDTELREEKDRRSDPLRPCFRVEFSTASMRAVIRQLPQVVSGWLDLAPKEDLDWAQINFLKSTYPVFEALCEALFLEGDTRASGLYTTVRDSTRQKGDSLTRDRVGDTLPLLLFRINVDEVGRHRNAWYQGCWSDVTLLDFATAARSLGRYAFLLQLIQNGLASPACFDQAKAVGLAGWCGTGVEFRSLLEGLHFESGSWFDSLKAQALSRSRREEWARFWFTAFLFSRSLAKSFAAFRLFLRCVDRRFYAWKGEILRKVRRSRYTEQRRVGFLESNHREIEKAIENNEKDLEKHFLHLNIPDTHFSPWTGLPPARVSGRRRNTTSRG